MPEQVIGMGVGVSLTAKDGAAIHGKPCGKKKKAGGMMLSGTYRFSKMHGNCKNEVTEAPGHK